MFHSIRWRIAVPYIVVTLLALLGLTLLVTNRAARSTWPICARHAAGRGA